MQHTTETTPLKQDFRYGDVPCQTEITPHVTVFRPAFIQAQDRYLAAVTNTVYKTAPESKRAKLVEAMQQVNLTITEGKVDTTSLTALKSVFDILWQVRADTTLSAGFRRGCEQVERELVDYLRSCYRNFYDAFNASTLASKHAHLKSADAGAAPAAYPTGTVAYGAPATPSAPPLHEAPAAYPPGPAATALAVAQAAPSGASLPVTTPIAAAAEQIPFFNCHFQRQVEEELVRAINQIPLAQRDFCIGNKDNLLLKMKQLVDNPEESDSKFALKVKEFFVYLKELQSTILTNRERALHEKTFVEALEKVETAIIDYMLIASPAVKKYYDDLNLAIRAAQQAGCKARCTSVCCYLTAAAFCGVGACCDSSVGCDTVGHCHFRKTTRTQPEKDEFGVVKQASSLVSITYTDSIYNSTTRIVKNDVESCCFYPAHEASIAADEYKASAEEAGRFFPRRGCC